MEAIRIIAENRIEEAIEDGVFDNLPRRGYIDCSLSGERFFAEWFSKFDRDDEPNPKGAST